MQLKAGTAFPPARVGVVRSDLHKAEFQVIVRAHPLGGVDRALLQGLVDLAARNVLWHAADALDDSATEAANAELGALEVGQRLDLPAEPAAHLGAGVAHWEVDDVVLAIEVTQQFQAVAFVVPGRHLAAVQSEGDGTGQGEGLVLAEVVVGRGVGHLDRAVFDRVDGAEGRHQFARSVRGDLEAAARQFAHLGGKDVVDAKQGVQHLGEARRQAPANRGLRVNGRRNTGC